MRDWAALVQRVGAFHLTDKSMKSAQHRAEEALKAGTFDRDEQARYGQAVTRYFSGFVREARSHLRDVDRRLESLNQVQFNLTAERAVAVKRIEATSGVLEAIASAQGANE